MLNFGDIDKKQDEDAELVHDHEQGLDQIQEEQCNPDPHAHLHEIGGPLVPGEIEHASQLPGEIEHASQFYPEQESPSQSLSKNTENTENGLLSGEEYIRDGYSASNIDSQSQGFRQGEQTRVVGKNLKSEPFIGKAGKVMKLKDNH